MILLLTVRGIENKKYRTSEYVNLNINFFSKFKGINTPATAYIIREIYIIENFKTNILVGRATNIHFHVMLFDYCRFNFVIKKYLTV